MKRFISQRITNMCFTRRKQKQKRQKTNKVIPYEVPMTSFTVDEVIECFGCKEFFPLLDSNLKPSIKIHCAGCDHFFHCKVAGTCYGPNCSHKTRLGDIHRLAWCTDCAITKNDKGGTRTGTRDVQCVCKECFKL
jgi:hypothetical protein